MPKLLSLIIFLLVSNLGFSQDQRIYYINDKGIPVKNLDSAEFIRILSSTDKGTNFYNLLDQYKSGNKKAEGTVSNLVPLIYQGQLVTYYENGKKKSVQNFKNNLITGSESDFYPNGKIYVQKVYPDEGVFNSELNTNFTIKACYDSLGNALVNDGNGYYKEYDGQFKYVIQEGKIKNGKQDSVWKGYYISKKITFIENYKNGVLISGVGTNEKGISMNYSKSRSSGSQYKGGSNAFNNYVNTNLNYPTGALQNNIEGKVYITFTVEEDGKLSNVRVLKSSNSMLDAEAVRLLKSSSNWKPLCLFGHNIKSSYTVPIVFKLPEN